jgi:MerR family transcriptional regulator/heat shock protein HspR
MNEEEEPRYGISIAARMVGVQTHTLRYYESVGIIEPHRSRGNIRLYSDSDIARLRQAKTLMDDLGVNLAGVEVILRMLGHMADLQGRLQKMEADLERLREADDETGEVY